MKQDDICWGLSDQEVLSPDPNTVLDDYVLPELEDPPQTPNEIIKVYEYTRMTPELSTKSVLYKIYEHLDDEYGRDGFETAPSETVTAKAQDLVSAILKEYVPWQCEKTGRYYKVDLQKYLSDVPDNMVLVDPLNS